MANTVRGAFEVEPAPLPTRDTTEGGPLSRRSIDKTFHGALAAVSVGELPAAGTAVKGSAGYVAMERVTGTLGGNAGSCVVMHTGVMNRCVPSLTVRVAPDSGTGELTGMTGTMAIGITGGKHYYEFELPVG